FHTSKTPPYLFPSIPPYKPPLKPSPNPCAATKRRRRTFGRACHSSWIAGAFLALQGRKENKNFVPCLPYKAIGVLEHCWVLRTKYANMCILEPFGAVLGMEWIAYAWSKVDGRN
ncbi:hypothetical protein DVH24_021530, partial [Malus domestica]